MVQSHKVQQLSDALLLCLCYALSALICRNRSACICISEALQHTDMSLGQCACSWALQDVWHRFLSLYEESIPGSKFSDIVRILDHKGTPHLISLRVEYLECGTSCS